MRSERHNSLGQTINLSFILSRQSRFLDLHSNLPPNIIMTNNENPSRRELSNPLEEEDLWDLDDEWTEESEDDASDPTQVAEPTPPKSAPLTSPGSETEVSQDTPSPAPINTDHLPTPEIATPDSAPAPTSPPSNNRSEELEDSTPDTQEASKEATTATLGKATLSALEKLALALVGISLLGLAIYSYIWLYGKNQNDDGQTVNLPIKGDYITVSAFSTYWTTANQSSDIKMGAAVLPSASITIDSGSNASGALRIYFRNVDDNRIGDPITLSIKDGKFAPSHKSNITVGNLGSTVEVTSSDGFHQEGDFRAYVLDTKLAWKIFVLEAKNTSASGSDFKEIISTKVEPNRK